MYTMPARGFILAGGTQDQPLLQPLIWNRGIELSGQAHAGFWLALELGCSGALALQS